MSFAEGLLAGAVLVAVVWLWTILRKVGKVVDPPKSPSVEGLKDQLDEAVRRRDEHVTAGAKKRSAEGKSPSEVAANTTNRLKEKKRP